jgi:hypothetical protein
MKINLQSIDRSQFLVQERLVNGETMVLVNPQHVGVKWTPENLHYRSSLWTLEGELVSASFKKFFNWGEQPNLAPIPNSLAGHSLIEKLDGSTLIVSRYKGNLIIRTRGTADATGLENGHEIALLRKCYPYAFNHVDVNCENYSVIFEWLSPTNKIVIDYGAEPEIRLIGQISHRNYALTSQKELDVIAEEMGVKRPKRFSFDTVEEMIGSVEKLQGQEGLCCYSPDGQNIRKVKSAWYLALHRFKENATLDNTVDLFFEYGCPNFLGFQGKLVQTFDYECWNMVQGFASCVVDAYEQATRIASGMVRFVEPLKSVSRKEAAQKILASYGQTNRASFCFQILDGKTLDIDAQKKLLWQCLKK